MHGTGPVAQAAAFHAAGVGIRKVAPLVGVPLGEISQLLLGFWLQEARDQDPQFELVSEPGLCRIGGCGRAAMRLRLCQAHAFRFYDGNPLLGGGRRARSPGIHIDSCGVCGVQWCRLTDRRRITCGDPACRGGRRGADPERQARNAAILARVRAGEQYRDIAVAFGLSEPRVGQLARTAGIRRRKGAAQSGGSAILG